MLALTLEARTWAHRLPAGLKLALVALVVVLALPVTDPRLVAGLVVAVAGLYASLGRQAMRMGLRLLRPLAVVLAIIMIWHLVLHEARLGLLICLRILALVGLANLVTITTRLDDLMAVVEWLLAPLSRLGLPTSRVALAVALVIRQIPALATRAEALRAAWRARATRRPGRELALPLVLSALDDAEQVADALRARGGLAPPAPPDEERT